MRKKSGLDYSTFGSPMEGRSFVSSSYRYGFNGKENDPESVGTGEGLQDYGMRIYNPSLGRFLSVDPIAASYPFYSPYQFAGNMPTIAMDIDGLEQHILIFVYAGSANDGTPPQFCKLINWSDLFPGEEHGPMGGGEAIFDLSNNKKSDNGAPLTLSFRSYLPTRSEYIKSQMGSFFHSYMQAQKQILYVAVWPLAKILGWDPGGFEQTGSGKDPNNSTQTKSKKSYGQIDTEALLKVFELLSTVVPEGTQMEKPVPEFDTQEFTEKAYELKEEIDKLKEENEEKEKLEKEENENAEKKAIEESDSILVTHHSESGKRLGTFFESRRTGQGRPATTRDSIQIGVK